MRHIQRYLHLLLLILLCIQGGCSRPTFFRLSVDEFPSLADDLEYAGLEAALGQSLIYLEEVTPQTRYSIGDRTISAHELIQSVRLLRRILAEEPDQIELQNMIRENFDLYQARGVSGWNPERHMLVTGYYQPVFNGSLDPTYRFRYPLYGVPDDLVVQRSNTEKEVVKIGRFEEGKLVPYWSRKEIEQKNLLAGQEIVWLENPLDAFFLHIQGSGLIRLLDGTTRGVHYAQRNGRAYNSIGKYMVDKGKISLQSASLQAIRSYIEKHPEERDEILHHNDAYIFFHWTRTVGAVGSIGRELTPGRSIAADRRVFPPGAVVFLVSRQPEFQEIGAPSWKEFKRFVTVQDTGAAIQGPGRVDVFWGSGERAGQAAGMMKEDGTCFILLPKDNRS